MPELTLLLDTQESIQWYCEETEVDYERLQYIAEWASQDELELFWHRYLQEEIRIECDFNFFPEDPSVGCDEEIELFDFAFLNSNQQWQEINDVPEWLEKIMLDEMRSYD